MAIVDPDTDCKQPVNVTITGIDIPFFDMVVQVMFWMLASIIASIPFVLIAMVLWMLLIAF